MPSKYHGWELHEKDGMKAYGRVHTLDGGAQAVELPFDSAINLKRIELYFNSVNARDLNIRMFAQHEADAFVEFDSQTGHITNSRYLDFGDGYVYLDPVKLQLNFDNSTNGDKVNILVMLDGIK